MSKTVPVRFDGFGFWVYDVAASVLWAQMADIAAAGEPSPWLSDLVHQLRVDAIVGADHAVPLDEWSRGHEDEFIALVDAAARRLAERGSVTRAEADAWIVLDDEPLPWRGTAALDTEPVVEFARALIAIIRGEHPAPPADHTWYFGQRGGVVTVDWVGRR